MTTTETDVEPKEGAPKPRARPTPVQREQTDVKRQPPYSVILQNDDLNGMDFVVNVLRKVFNYGRLKAVGLMLKAHVTGRSIVWTGSLEVAELKADQIRSCGPDPNMKHRGATTLSVSVEAAPQYWSAGLAAAANRTRFRAAAADVLTLEFPVAAMRVIGPTKRRMKDDSCQCSNRVGPLA